MSHRKKISFVIFTIVIIQLFLLVSITDATGVEFSTIVDSVGDVGQMSSLAIVDEFPAIAYEDHDANDLRYVRALDAQGTTWGTSQTVGSYVYYGKIELIVVDGYPAIAYYDYWDENLYFVRATDAQGSNWGSPICVDCEVYDRGDELSMAIINGFPAVVYQDYDNDQVLFVRAINAQGSAWGTPILVSEEYANDIEMVVANGKPAVSYFNKYDDTVEYVLANDANGTTWGSVQILDTLTDYDELEMKIVNGNPAIAYYDLDNEIMYFIRASNADGTSWGSRVVVKANDYVDSYQSLAIIDGYPTIAYQRNSESQQDDDLALIQASDINGASWKEPRILLSTGDIGESNSLIALPGGGLGVTTHNGGNVGDLYYFSYIGSVEPDTVAPTVIYGIKTIPFTGSRLTTGPTQITIEFNENVSQESAELEENFLLIEIGENGYFDTTSCAVPGGDTVALDDEKININTASYDDSDPFITTLTINDGIPLPIGTYRLLICGTTSIEDLVGNELNDGISDSQINFIVELSQTSASSLPDVGFPQGRITLLSEQLSTKRYTSLVMQLEIPKLGIRTNIVGVPQLENSWDVSWLGNSAGYLIGSAFPTWAGNTVITGHVWDNNNHPGVFSDLKSLQYGDQIQIHTSDTIFTYEVRESELISQKDIDSVFASEDFDWITLLTCESYNPISEEYLFRREVRAVLVNVR